MRTSSKSSASSCAAAAGWRPAGRAPWGTPYSATSAWCHSVTSCNSGPSWPKSAAARCCKARRARRSAHTSFSARCCGCSGPHLIFGELTQVFRQDHAHYMRLLHEIRTGELSQFAQQQIKALTAGQPGKSADDPESTYIFLRNEDVKAHNEARLGKLPGTERVFKAEDASSGDANWIKEVLGASRLE